MVSLLLSNNADPNITAKEGDTIRVQSIKEMKSVEIDPLDLTKYTALMAAVKVGSVSSVQALVRFGANINARTSRGTTCVMIAAEEGRDECLRELLNHNININATNVWGQNALMLSARFRHPKCLDLILHYYKRKYHKGVLSKFFALDVRIFSTASSVTKLPTDEDGGGGIIDMMTDVLREVIKENNVGCTEVFLDHGLPVDYDSIQSVRSGNGMTLLHYAIHCCQIETIALFLTRGADVNKRYDFMGRSWNALSVAAPLGDRDPNKEILHLLFAAGCDHSKTITLKGPLQVFNEFPKRGHVPFLTELCRISICESMRNNFQCPNLIVGVSTLPLPKRLKYYLLYSIDSILRYELF